jgi:cytochrome c
MRSLLSLSITATAVGFAGVPANYAQAGNAGQGDHAFAKCALCHAKDKSNGIGPGLLGVVGRHAGSVPGFRYSQAMKNSNVVWDRKSLDAFIMTPQKALPGITMLFPGIPSQEERKRSDRVPGNAQIAGRQAQILRNPSISRRMA